MPGRTVARRDLAWSNSRWADIHGIDVHYVVDGPDDAAGPIVLLNHHFYGHTFAFSAVQAGLAERGIRSVSFDRPGFGLTERPRDLTGPHGNPYARPAAVQLAAGLLDELGADTTIVLGASMGGTVAVEFAATLRDRSAGLVLLAPAITGDVGLPPPLRPLGRTAPLRTVGSAVIRRFAGDITNKRVTTAWFDGSGASDELVDAYQRSMRAEGWDRGLWNAFCAEPPPSHLSTLPTLDLPAWVVTGTHDRTVTPKLTARTAALIPGATFVQIPECGHTPHEEQPATVVDLLADAHAQVTGSQAQPATSAN